MTRSGRTVHPGAHRGTSALDWATNAGNQGFRMSGVPHTRSIVVWPANQGINSSLGHVAWVTRVWVSGGATYFRVREMNWSGWNVWSERDVKHADYMRFIVAPPGTPVDS